MRHLLLLTMIAFVWPQGEVFAADTKGRIQLSIVNGDDLSSWLDKDTGVVRYDESGVNLQQAFVRIQQDITPVLDVSADLGLYADGDQSAGVTQLQLRYKPLLEGDVKWRMRLGLFYPGMSLENVDVGWLSPYSYNQSALNSWIGEELRSAGLEFTLYKNARRGQSPWSWELHAGVYKGNDPLGSVISWRGFATHDRQSLHHERVEFARYPTVGNQLDHPSWVEPFKEIDGRAGIYVGAHLEHKRNTQLRYYYYDNLADPNAVNDQRLYAWRTKFHSVAFQHNFSQSTRLISQLMTGSSLMGERFVYIDFDAAFLMLSHKRDKHRISLRYDYFNVDEDDVFPQDQNNSDGEAVTVSWRYRLTEQWEIGVEHLINSNTAINRSQFAQSVKQTQHQSLLVAQFSW